MNPLTWELTLPLALVVLFVGVMVAFGLSAIAEALRILATRIAAHTDVVRMATTPRPHLQAVSGDAKGKCSPTKSTPPANGMGPRWDYPK